MYDLRLFLNFKFYCISTVLDFFMGKAFSNGFAIGIEGDDHHGSVEKFSYLLHRI